MRVWVGGRGEGLCEGGVEGIEWSGIKGGGGGGGKVLSGPVSSGLVLCVRRCYFAIIA